MTDTELLERMAVRSARRRRKIAKLQRALRMESERCEKLKAAIAKQRRYLAEAELINAQLAAQRVTAAARIASVYALANTWRLKGRCYDAAALVDALHDPGSGSAQLNSRCRDCGYALFAVDGPQLHAEWCPR